MWEVPGDVMFSFNIYCEDQRGGRGSGPRLQLKFLHRSFTFNQSGIGLVTGGRRRLIEPAARLRRRMERRPRRAPQLSRWQKTAQEKTPPTHTMFSLFLSDTTLRGGQIRFVEGEAARAACLNPAVTNYSCHWTQWGQLLEQEDLCLICELFFVFGLSLLIISTPGLWENVSLLF